jgi:acyl-CoA reductase-like NAD-dependent aldehyde dehydrogenase
VSGSNFFHDLLANGGSMILRKAGAALAAGCAMIVKPSPETPLSVLALAELAMQAGFPKGVFSVLTTSLENTPPLSEALCRHPLIKKVTFTGSVSPFCISPWVAILTFSRLVLAS